ncbi:IclR family transcriptional regulator [Oceanobacillus jeddahense]|uniref:IclR family transcriptional regulator n=1 Tax=Oceanobacillus jeddahense TaxID=1462527 RepID=A0ABY5JQ78_9BACI|nr:IclR family transcriptional regulator [Oceanobacillus jeddahense]UUI02465.1 IclR family transcriptional regulator [Oceanobacillus jeddahense]
MDNKNNVQSVERAVDLLFCFSMDEYELSISDFVDKTKLNRTTVFRILQTLKVKGIIIQNEQTGLYRLGYEFIRMAQIVNENLDIRQDALPYLKKLSKETKETVSLNIIRAKRRICIEKVDGTEDIRQFVELGYPYYLVKGASGKVLLAFNSKEYAEEALKEWESVHGTIINREEFYQELESIRENKVAISDSDRVFGAYSVSAPIIGPDEKPIAGISISGLSIRLTEEKKAVYKKLIRDTAIEISNYFNK